MEFLIDSVKSKKINKKVLELSSEQQNYDKGDFKHFMAKEIEENTQTFITVIKEYVDSINKAINIYNFSFKMVDIK